MRQRPISLGELARRGIKVSAWCEACGRYRELATAPLVARLGSAMPVTRAGRHLKCSTCGSRRCDLRPHYPGLGVVAHHRWRQDGGG
jgi:hypothetical protein